MVTLPHLVLDCPSLQEHLVHRTFLEELVFWTVKFEFPQKVVCLLLNMLPDPDYKVGILHVISLHSVEVKTVVKINSLTFQNTLHFSLSPGN